MKRGGDIPDGRGKVGPVNPADGPAGTIGEWIDRSERPVPAEFRPHLSAGGPVSPDTLLAAAEQEVRGCAAGNPRDRRTAFSLLAADAYVTCACALAIEEGAEVPALAETARRVAQGWWEYLR